MSHDYHLRPNVKARMQRRLNAYVAAFGEQNRDKIFAEPSKTGQGVHLRFDPERSLSPDPNHAAYCQGANSTKDMIVVDESDSGSSLSGLGSDLDTVAPDTPSARTQFCPSSHRRAPMAPRHVKREYEGSIKSSSVHDSLALIVERKQAPKAHLDGDVEDRRLILEYECQKMLEQAKNEEEKIAALRREYEGKVEQFRKENADIFSFAEEDTSDCFDYSPPLSPEPSGHVAFPPEKDKLVTRRYRVRAEELESIDGDGDSVMGSDD